MGFRVGNPDRNGQHVAPHPSSLKQHRMLMQNFFSPIDQLLDGQIGWSYRLREFSPWPGAGSLGSCNQSHTFLAIFDQSWDDCIHDCFDTPTQDLQGCLNLRGMGHHAAHSDQWYPLWLCYIIREANVKEEEVLPVQCQTASAFNDAFGGEWHVNYKQER